MSFDPWKLARKEVLDLPVYSPGRSPEEIASSYGISDCVKMASNENPLGPSPLALRAILENLERCSVYPDSHSQELRSALSQKLGVSPEMILVSHGADEAMDLIAYAFLDPGDEVVVAHPTFTSYELAALTMGARVIKVPLRNYRQDLKAMLAEVSEKTKVVFVCSPLNPTGTVVMREEWEKFLENFPPSVLCLLDEAYVEYVDEEARFDSLSYIRSHPFLIISRTFSKIYGLAGLRVGYSICSPEIREILEKVKLPFNVNQLGQIAAKAALEDQEHLRRSREVNARGKKRITELLEELGLDYVPTQANFILVKNGRFPDLYQQLLRKGVIVRDGVPLGIPGHIRITIGDQRQNDRLEEALRSLVREERKD